MFLQVAILGGDYPKQTSLHENCIPSSEPGTSAEKHRSKTRRILDRIEERRLSVIANNDQKGDITRVAASGTLR